MPTVTFCAFFYTAEIIVLLNNKDLKESHLKGISSQLKDSKSKRWIKSANGVTAKACLHEICKND